MSGRLASANCVEDDDLARTIEMSVGVACTTLCGGCADAGTLPRFASWMA
jgi:hypothetical protein